MQDPRQGLIAVKANIDGKTITLHPDDIVLVYEKNAILEALAAGVTDIRVVPVSTEPSADKPPKD